MKILKKLISNKFKAILSSILAVITAFLPSLSMAKINSVYDLKYEGQQMLDKISSSPIFGMIGYSVALVGVFVFGVVAIFLLIMILKTD